MDFTGDYYKCTNCKHVYDFNDVCPDCGSGNVEDVNVNEVKEHIKNAHGDERLRLQTMLGNHDDL